MVKIMMRRLGIAKSDFSLMTSAVEHGIYHANSGGHAVIRYNHRH